MFTNDLSDPTEHYVELAVSGECFEGEFNERFLGVISEGVFGTNCPNYLLGGGCIGDGGSKRILVEPTASPDVLKFCVTIPWSQHHGSIDFNISLTYRTICTPGSNACSSCGNNQHFFNYFRHEGVITYDDPPGGALLQCTTGMIINFINDTDFGANQFSCVSSATCKP